MNNHAPLFRNESGEEFSRQDFQRLIQYYINQKKELTGLVQDKNPIVFMAKLLAHVAIKKPLQIRSLAKTESKLPSLSQNNHTSKINYDDSWPGITLFTSGSEGAPKEINHTLNNIKKSAQAFKDFYSPPANFTYALTLPHHHVGGLMILFRCYFLGGTINFHSKSDWRKLIQESFDYYSLVPAQLESPFANGLRKAKAIIVGGGPLSTYVFNQLIDQQIPVSVSYGMTETMSMIAASYPGQNGPGLTFLPHTHAIINDQTLQIEKCESLCHSINNQEQQVPWKTHDCGKMIKNKFHFTSRKDDIFISGGENISPREVENILLESLPLQEAYLLPTPHPRFGEVGTLFYKSQQIKTFQLKAQIKKILPSHQVPYYYYGLDQHSGLKPSRYNLKILAKALQSWTSLNSK